MDPSRFSATYKFKIEKHDELEDSFFSEASNTQSQKRLVRASRVDRVDGMIVLSASCKLNSLPNGEEATISYD